MSELLTLQKRLGCEWPSINGSRDAADAKQQELTKLLERYGNEDTSIVVFGSLARKEWTIGSDLDWSMFVDGQAKPEHREKALRIRKLLEGHKPPNPAGSFGKIVFSHDLVHHIGGDRDTNRNTTQRVLLLLESIPIGRRDAYDRVVNNVLIRYLEVAEEAKPRRQKESPRFLLNDIVRFWRIMAVDFASKHWDEKEKKWGSRNIKLRMSRKLLFASGLLICFSCLNTGLSREDLRDHVRTLIALEPLEILAKSASTYGISDETCRSLFSSYEAFLASLSDSNKREHLENLRVEDAASSPVFNEMREVSDAFHSSLIRFFFAENKGLTDLTTRYGVF